MSKNYIYPATLLCDFYKVGHREQYPENTEKIYSTWTPRTSRIKGIDKVVSFGFQAFIKEYLINYFNEKFFNRNLDDVVNEYQRVIKYTLSVQNPNASHIISLHKLGYLPLQIKAVKEGTLIPIRIPMLTVENTKSEFFWLTNYIETLMSCYLWQPSTSATLAREYRKILDEYAEKTGGDMSFIQFQGHDFSMRGMGSLESAKSSGAGHLLSFIGTDTIPAILYLEEFYNANIENELVGTSIPALEHSVVCSGGSNDEFSTLKRMLTEVYPNGMFSYVSDSWDLWHVLTNYLPKLKNIIMNRDGKIVIRPDSGDPVKIICGDSESSNENERKGVVEILWDIFGGTVTDKGYKVLDSHIGCIYGDAITIERCKEICEQLMKKGFASTNMVYGIGSFTYQYNTRDTFGFALKSTFAQIDREEKQLFKDPVTDSGIKKSQKGMVVISNINEKIEYIDELNENGRKYYENIDILENVFVDGKLLRDESLTEIRERVLSNM